MKMATNTSLRSKKPRHAFSDEEKAVLLDAYQRGMISTSHPLVDSSAQELNLDKKLIKTWVNNRNRFVQGRAVFKKKIKFQHGQNSFNIYMEGKHVDQSSPEFSFSGHAKKWRALPPQVKEEYKKQAADRKANGPPPPAEGKERSKRIKYLLQSLNPVIKQLVDLRLEVCGHVFDKDFCAFFGTELGHSLAESDKFNHKIEMFMDTQKVPEKEGTDLMREVRAILNEAFSKFIGKPHSRVPYHSIINGDDYGVTMPDGISFKPPQAMSIAALKTIRDKGVTFFRLLEPETHPEIDSSSPGHSSMSDDIPDVRLSPTLDAASILKPLAEGGFLPLGGSSIEPQTSATEEMLEPAARTKRPKGKELTKEKDKAPRKQKNKQPKVPNSQGALQNRNKRKVTAPKRLIENASGTQGAIHQKENGKGKKKATSGKASGTQGAIQQKKNGKGKKKATSEKVYLIDKVSQCRWRNGKEEFLVKWKGYGDEANTWEPEENFEENFWENFERPSN